MRRGCVIGLLVGVAMLAGVAWIASDPLKALWLLADYNGGITKWQTRVGRITEIKRECDISPEANDGSFELSPQDCASSAKAKALLESNLGKLAVDRMCFRDRNHEDAKNCKQPIKGPSNGIAKVIVENAGQDRRAFHATIEVSSSKSAFYMFKEGDLIQLDLCSTNPTVARVEARFAAVPGC